MLLSRFLREIEETKQITRTTQSSTVKHLRIYLQKKISVRDDTQYLYNIKLETTVISLITSNCVMGDNGLRNASTRNSGNVASSHTILKLMEDSF